MPICCTCNRSGRCRNCSCVKARRTCSSCQPQKLARCENLNMTDFSTQQQSATTIPVDSDVCDSNRNEENPVSNDTEQHKGRTSSSSLVNVEADAEEPSMDSGRIQSTVTDLPPFPSRNAPNFAWGKLDGESFCQTINSAYNEAITWWRNLFLVPTGKIGSSFVTTLTDLFRSYGEAPAMELIALKAAMVMPILLLQKPHGRSRTRDQIVKRRMILWESGNIGELVQECRTIQGQLRTGQRYGNSNDNKQHTT